MVYCFSHITVHGSSQIRPSPVWIWHFHSRKQSQNEGSIESPRDMRVPMMANPNFSLVGGLEHFFYFMTFHMLGMSSSQLTNSIIFQRGRLNHQPAGLYHPFLVILGFLIGITKLEARCNSIRPFDPIASDKRCDRGLGIGTLFRVKRWILYSY